MATDAAERAADAAKIASLASAVAELKKENLALKFRIRKTESEARAARETAEYALELEKEAEAALAETGSEVLVADTDDDDEPAAVDKNSPAAVDKNSPPAADGGAASDDSSESANGESYMVDHFAVGIKIDPKAPKPFYMLVSELDGDTPLSYEGRGRPRSVVPLKPCIFSFKILSDGEIAENAAAEPAGGTLPTPDMLRANKWIYSVVDQLRYAYADGAYAKWIEKHHDGLFGAFIADLTRRAKGDIGPFVTHLKQIVISNATVVRDFSEADNSEADNSEAGSQHDPDEGGEEESDDDPLIERYRECPESACVRAISTGKEFDVEITFGDSYRLRMKPWSSGDYASTGLTAKELKKNRYGPKKCQKVLSDLTGFSRSTAALHTGLFDATEQLRRLATLPADPKRPTSQTVLEWYIRTELSRASEFAADMENKTFSEIADAVGVIQKQCAKAHASLKRVSTGAGPAAKRGKK